MSSSELPAHDYVLGHWEFIRRYMEEGPEAISGLVQFCMPVDGRRETGRGSFDRTFANIAGAPILVYWAFVPLHLVISVFRMVAMRTCRIPLWPQEVEDACTVAVGDPFAMVGAGNGERVPVFPEAATAAGVKFCGRNVAG